MPRWWLLQVFYNIHFQIILNQMVYTIAELRKNTIYNMQMSYNQGWEDPYTYTVSVGITPTPPFLINSTIASNLHKSAPEGSTCNSSTWESWYTSVPPQKWRTGTFEIFNINSKVGSKFLCDWNLNRASPSTMADMKKNSSQSWEIANRRSSFS